MTKSSIRPPAIAATAIVASEGTGQTMESLPPGSTVSGDGSGEALPPVEPATPPAAAPAPAQHEWNDEFVGVGGSYVVVDGKRVPADQA